MKSFLIYILLLAVFLSCNKQTKPELQTCTVTLLRSEMMIDAYYTNKDSLFQIYNTVEELSDSKVKITNLKKVNACSKLKGEIELMDNNEVWLLQIDTSESECSAEGIAILEYEITGFDIRNKIRR